MRTGDTVCARRLRSVAAVQPLARVGAQEALQRELVAPHDQRSAARVARHERVEPGAEEIGERAGEAQPATQHSE